MHLKTGIQMINPRFFATMKLKIPRSSDRKYLVSMCNDRRVSTKGLDKLTYKVRTTYIQ